MREQVARERFLKIRQLQRAELASWWRTTISAALIEQDPELPERLSGFTLALQDGNAIAGASGESIKAFRPMLASSLIHLVAQAMASVGAGAAEPAPARPRKPRAIQAVAAAKAAKGSRGDKSAPVKA